MRKKLMIRGANLDLPKLDEHLRHFSIERCITRQIEASIEEAFYPHLDWARSIIRHISQQLLLLRYKPTLTISINYTKMKPNAFQTLPSFHSHDTKDSISSLKFSASYETSVNKVIIYITLNGIYPNKLYYC